MEIRRKLEQKFSESDLKWRVQSCGKRNGKNYVLFSVYLEVLTIQERLNYIFGWDGWKSKEYVNENHSVTVELSLWSDTKKEWVTRSGTADIVLKNNSSQDDNSIKSASTSAFKRASAAFGIGIYLKAFKTIWGTECPKDTKGALKCENKKENIEFYAIPKVPQDFYFIENKEKAKEDNTSNLKTQEIGKERAIELYKKLQETYKDNAEKAVKQLYLKFGIEKLEFLSESQLNEIETAKYDVLEIKVS